MADSDIQSLLFVDAQDFLNANAIVDEDIAWPNRDMDPAGKPLWAAVHYMPTDPITVSLGSGGLDREVGFMQIDLNVPRNTGDIVLRDMRDAARRYFITGKTLQQNSQIVIFTGCGVSNPHKVDNYHRVNITIYYRSDLQRTLIT